MVYDWMRVVLADYAAKLFLLLGSGFPRIVNQIFRVVFQLRNVLLDEETLWVCLLEKGDRRVNLEVLLEEAAGTEPLPVGIVQRPVCIEKETVKYFCSHFPVNPEVASCQETGNEMPCQVVHPSFLMELSHGRINRRIAGPCILPGLKLSPVSAPVDLADSLIPDHAVELIAIVAAQVKVLAKQQLTL